MVARPFTSHSPQNERGDRYTLSSRGKEGAMVSKLDEQVVTRSRDDISFDQLILPFRSQRNP